MSTAPSGSENSMGEVERRIEGRLSVTERSFDEKLTNLRSDLERKIREELDREVERLKLTVGAAWKVLGVAIVVIVGAATFFSIKTAYDVDKGIESAAKSEVSRRLDTEKSDSPSKRVLARALMDSYMLRLAKADADTSRFSSPVTLDDISAEQILDVVKDEQTKEEDFQEGVTVLVRAQTGDSGTRVFHALVSAVRADGQDFNWLNAQPSRRSYILTQLSRLDIADLVAASKLIIKTEPDPSLLRSAIFYVQQHGDRDSAEVLESKFKTTDSTDIQSAILLALARVKPTSPVLQEFIAKFQEGKADLAHLRAFSWIV